MRQEINQVLLPQANVPTPSPFHSLNIGEEEIEEERVVLIYSEKKESAYNNCTWRDMIFELT